MQAFYPFASLPCFLTLLLLMIERITAYTLLPAPPCSGDRGTDSFFVPNSIKPNICLGRHKDIQFDLTCTDVPVSTQSFINALGLLRAMAYSSISNNVPIVNYTSPVETTTCYNSPPPRRKRTTLRALLKRQQSGDFGAYCTEVQVTQLPIEAQTFTPQPGIPLVVLLPQGARSFTPGIWEDILDTLSQVPGADSAPLQCRIDIHTQEGVRFGEGCIATLQNYDGLHVPDCPVPMQS